MDVHREGHQSSRMERKKKKDRVIKRFGEVDLHVDFTKEKVLHSL